MPTSKSIVSSISETTLVVNRIRRDLNYIKAPLSDPFPFLAPYNLAIKREQMWRNVIGVAPGFRWWSVGPPVLDQLSTSDKEKAVPIGPIWTNYVSLVLSWTEDTNQRLSGFPLPNSSHLQTQSWRPSSLL